MTMIKKIIIVIIKITTIIIIMIIKYNDKNRYKLEWKLMMMRRMTMK